MAIWEVSIFGYYKPNYYLVDKTTKLIVNPYLLTIPVYDSNLYEIYTVQGNQYRAQPGDVIDFRPVGHPWTEDERKHFLIITLNGPTETQMKALCEIQWDLNSYKPYSPDGTVDLFVARMMVRIQVKKTSQIADNYNRMVNELLANKDAWYAKYIADCREMCRYPTRIGKKRRFGIPLTGLQAVGVDLTKMLDKEVLYSPVLPTVDKRICFDKINNRLVRNSDGLNLISPLTDLEIEARRI